MNELNISGVVDGLKQS